MSCTEGGLASEGEPLLHGVIAELAVLVRVTGHGDRAVLGQCRGRLEPARRPRLGIVDLLYPAALHLQVQM